MPLTDELLAEYGVTPRDIQVSFAMTKEGVRLWRRGIHEVSTENARLIEAKFGIPRHRIRPDIWDPPPQKTRRATRARASETAA